MKKLIGILLFFVFILALGCGDISRNGLKWRVGPDENTTWIQASDWIESQGDEWRMPTTDELRDLRDSGVSADDWGPFNNTGLWVWSGDLENPLWTAHSFSFTDDFYRLANGAGSSSVDVRVFAVRE